MTDRQRLLEVPGRTVDEVRHVQQSFAHVYHTAPSALDSSMRGRIGEQRPRSQTRVGDVALSINNGAGCNEIEIAVGSREKFFLDIPLS
jgi:hypothetical protein